MCVGCSDTVRLWRLAGQQYIASARQVQNATGGNWTIYDDLPSGPEQVCINIIAKSSTCEIACLEQWLLYPLTFPHEYTLLASFTGPLPDLMMTRHAANTSSSCQSAECLLNMYTLFLYRQGYEVLF